MDRQGILYHNQKKNDEGAIMKSSQADLQRQLDVLAGILMRCFLGGLLLLAVWFAWFVLAGDWIYRIHTQWFQVSRQAFDTIHYTGMAITKILLLVFALLPWIAIKLMSGKKD
jgi:hypothetical protein